VEHPPAGEDALPIPLFVFSITRSGSTLVQRVLGAYPEVATVSEPWLLIPLLYTRRREGVIAEYTHGLAADAIEDFCRVLPNGAEDYRAELRRFVQRLYAEAARGSGARYFLDKTPPYFFVIDDVLALFPDAPAILLWRNPLSVLASLIDFDGGAWDPARYRENLFDGLARLVEARRRHGERLWTVRYEDLVAGGDAEWRRIADHLGLAFDPTTLTRFPEVRLEGRMGDPFGVRQYSTLSAAPLDKWRRRLNNPLRKAWAARWLRWLGRERLEVMGYDLEVLLAQLRSVPDDNAELAGDARRFARALVREPARAHARRMLGLGGPSSFRHLLGPVEPAVGHPPRLRVPRTFVDHGDPVAGPPGR
jgi:hypothetical protein